MENAPGFKKIEYAITGTFETHKTILIDEEPRIQIINCIPENINELLFVSVEADLKYDDKNLIYTQTVKLNIPIPNRSQLTTILNKFRTIGGILVMTDKINQRWVYGCQHFPLYLTSELNLKSAREIICTFTSKSDSEPLLLAK